MQGCGQRQFWLNREQASTIDYLKEENRVLRERLGSGRLTFTDAERRRLAVKAKALCRSLLREISALVTPDTLLRWHRQLVAKKYDGGPHKNGARELEELLDSWVADLRDGHERTGDRDR